MKISEISNAEINIKIEIEVMESLIETTLITVSDAKKLADAGYKIQENEGSEISVELGSVTFYFGTDDQTDLSKP